MCRTIGSLGLSLGLMLGPMSTGAQTNLPTLPSAEKGISPSGNTLTPTPSPADSTVTREGQIVVPVKPTILDPTIYGRDVDRPFLTTRNQLSPELKERLLRFEQYRKAFLERQEALRKEYQTATDEDRIRIRERMELLRSQWLERMRELRLELKERQRELAGKLREHSEVIRSTREDARDVVREQATTQREQIREQLNEQHRGD